MRAVVLGGYGLIGSACLRALAQAGFAVTGVGRSPRAVAAAHRSGLATGSNVPGPGAVDWVTADMARLTVEDWRDLLAGADVVVNAAGALQDGARDDLEAIHVTAVERMVAALAGRATRVVQISAAGVRADAPTPFFTTKARGDGVLAASGLDHVILRPVLVIAPGAYGGTALLRAAASLPGLLPRVMPEAEVQCVHIDDLTAAVVLAAEGPGGVASGTVADLSEAPVRSLPETLALLRAWLGWAPPRFRPRVPGPVLGAISGVADLAGAFGWRSPLRHNAVAALSAGVRGDPDAWAAAGGAPCRTLDEALAAMPATLQDRWFARAWLAFPVAVVLLALFWTVSGLVGLMRFDAAAQVLLDRGVAPGVAAVAVAGGAVADLGLGLAILWRRWTAAASLGMIVLSLVYMAGAAWVAPVLWADPMGPMVKVLPGIGLALFTALLAVER